MPLTHRLRIQLNFDIGLDAAVLDIELSIGIPDRDVRRHYVASVHQLGEASQTHQATPRALADQFAHPEAMEVPGHGLATRTSKFIRYHRLRSENGALRLDRVGPVARAYDTHDGPFQVFDDVGCQRAAMIETFVDDSRFLAHLREEVAIEARVATEKSVRHVDVRHAAVAYPVHVAAVVFLPPPRGQNSFVFCRHHPQLAGALPRPPTAHL